MKSIFLMHLKNSFSGLLVVLVAIACTDKSKRMAFNERIDVEPATWIESNVIQSSLSDSIVVNNGEYSVNNGNWIQGKNSISEGDKVQVRVMSSTLPNDVTMCEMILGNDSAYFQVKTKNFTPTAKQGGARTINLGISGPNSAAIGGPSRQLLKYNSDKEKVGSAVKEGLIPDINPLFDAQIRDAVVCIGGDGRYYLTGSTGSDIWHFNDGVELWVSENLREWDYMGLVWTFEKDATWEKAWRFHHKAVRALWAPEIHYVKDNYFITHSMPPGGRGLLKSATGKPEGPYVNALENDGFWKEDIDGSLFQDEDGSVYYLYGGGWIAKMKDDMSGLAEEPVKPVLIDPDMNPAHHARTCASRRNCQDIGHEGAFMFKRNGLYYLTAADSYQGRYSSMVAVSENIYGPYKWRHEAVPCGGGTSYFKDHEGQWWCTYFGNDNQSPFREMPGIIKVDFTSDGKVFPSKDQPQLNTLSQQEWEQKWTKVWKDKYVNL
jgi:glycoside hydrolase family 43